MNNAWPTLNKVTFVSIRLPRQCSSRSVCQVPSRLCEQGWRASSQSSVDAWHKHPAKLLGKLHDSSADPETRASCHPWNRRIGEMKTALPKCAASMPLPGQGWKNRPYDIMNSCQQSTLKTAAYRIPWHHDGTTRHYGITFFVLSAMPTSPKLQFLCTCVATANCKMLWRSAESKCSTESKGHKTSFTMHPPVSLHQLISTAPFFASLPAAQWC